MLSPSELKNYASLRGVSVRDIEAYCDLSAGHISNVFNGERSMTEEVHMKIANGINAAYAAKLNGTFTRPPLDKNKNAIKPDKQDKGDESKAPVRGRKRTVSK
jgi:transcriptional regulator with XRE-family HTH domain|nr:MAG TPA: helix-turn-helix protein [Caudoviricetes sp.]